MARNGSGVYSLPAGSTITNGDTSDATDLNTPLTDLETDANTARPVVAGGTGASTASGARTNLGLGTIATQAANSVDIDGGAIDGTAVGANSASTGAFTTLSASGALTVGAEIVETVYALSGTTPAFDPANGTIQTWTLSGNSTPTDSLAAGESILLMVDDGSAYTVTWPTMTWVNNAGSAPTLATSGYTVVCLWKVSTTLYGALVGDGS